MQRIARCPGAARVGLPLVELGRDLRPAWSGYDVLHRLPVLQSDERKCFALVVRIAERPRVNEATEFRPGVLRQPVPLRQLIVFLAEPEEFLPAFRFVPEPLTERRAGRQFFAPMIDRSVFLAQRMQVGRFVAQLMLRYLPDRL